MVVRRVGWASTHLRPFPYFLVFNVLPLSLFDRLNAEYPKDLEGMKVDDTTPYRYWLRTDTTERFRAHTGLVSEIGQKLGINGKVGVEARLARDLPEYTVAPHTDTIGKAASVLFYLGGEGGTSLYNPDLSKVTTLPHEPNSAFGFARTNQSFHGVEKQSRTGYRDSLIYMIYRA